MQIGNRLVVAVVAAASSALAGILGGFLANRWSWGLAAFVLTFIAVFAGLEGLKILQSAKAAPGDATPAPRGTGHPREEAPPDPLAAVASADRPSQAVGISAAGRSRVSGVSITGSGDIKTTNVNRGSSGFVAVVIALIALLSVTIGTVYFAALPADGSVPASDGTDRAAAPAPPPPSVRESAAAVGDAPSSSISANGGSGDLRSQPPKERVGDTAPGGAQESDGAPFDHHGGYGPKTYTVTAPSDAWLVTWGYRCSNTPGSFRVRSVSSWGNTNYASTDASMAGRGRTPVFGAAGELTIRVDTPGDCAWSITFFAA